MYGVFHAAAEHDFTRQTYDLEVESESETLSRPRQLVECARVGAVEIHRFDVAGVFDAQVDELVATLEVGEAAALALA